MKFYDFKEGIKIIEDDFFRKFSPKFLKTMEKSDREYYNQIKSFISEMDEFFQLSYNEGSTKTYLEIFSEVLQEITAEVLGEYILLFTISLENGKMSIKNVKYQISRNEAVRTDWEFFHNDILKYIIDEPDELIFTFSGTIFMQYQLNKNYLLSKGNLDDGDGLLIELAIQAVGTELTNFERDEFYNNFDNFLYGLTLCMERKLVYQLRRRLMYRFRDYLIEEFGS